MCPAVVRKAVRVVRGWCVVWGWCVLLTDAGRFAGQTGVLAEHQGGAAVVRGWCENHEPIRNIWVQVGHAPPTHRGVVRGFDGRRPVCRRTRDDLARQTICGKWCVRSMRARPVRGAQVAHLGVTGAGGPVFDVV